MKKSKYSKYFFFIHCRLIRSGAVTLVKSSFLEVHCFKWWAWIDDDEIELTEIITHNKFQSGMLFRGATLSRLDKPGFAQIFDANKETACIFCKFFLQNRFFFKNIWKFSFKEKCFRDKVISNIIEYVFSVGSNRFDWIVRNQVKFSKLIR